MSDLFELLDSSPDILISDAFVITNNKIKNYDKIVCAISGGSDSDIMLDMCTKLDPEKKIRYVWFNTGLEYQATKDHLDYLEKKYGIKIERIKAKKPIPLSCREYGQPFLSKQVSEFIYRLQRHNFKWEDKPYEELLEEYPKCKASLKWWCNRWGNKKNGTNSKFNISYYKYLKEFMVSNSPDYFISPKCCYFAKKKIVSDYIRDNNIDLSLSGVRKSEGGARASAYKNCFTSKDNGADEYRPIFWYLNETKRKYEEVYNVTHSDCYCVYGLDRTGCAGCPFGKYFEKELEVIEKYEPKLYKAVNNIFGKSYDYTRRYYQFREERKSKEVAL